MAAPLPNYAGLYHITQENWFLSAMGERAVTSLFSTGVPRVWRVTHIDLPDPTPAGIIYLGVTLELTDSTPGPGFTNRRLTLGPFNPIEQIPIFVQGNLLPSPAQVWALSEVNAVHGFPMNFTARIIPATKPELTAATPVMIVGPPLPFKEVDAMPIGHLESNPLWTFTRLLEDE